MAAPVFHRHNAHGPVCGTRQGCDAADFDPPVITCRRCCKIPPRTHERQVGFRKRAAGDWTLLLLPPGEYPVMVGGRPMVSA